MNEHFFGLKRAYHGFLRVTRRPFQILGLTAARYDLMYALMLRDKDSAYRPMLQSALRRELGVAGSVVSRMLRSLENLDLITRKPKKRDRRQREIRLTEKGLACIRYAYRALVHSSQRLLCLAICFGKPGDAFFCMLMFEEYLLAMRREYGDTARLVYPWHPDD
jgi:DNA-binding MarR family transcriptional regulator